MKTYSKTFLLALSTLLLLTGTVSAQPVSSEQARQIASQFMTERGKTLAARTPHRAPRTGGQVADEASYYVFNAEANKGFVIVSGDERAMPVLGYTDEGTFDAENLPDGLQWLLENYQYQMSHAFSSTNSQPTNNNSQIYHAPRQARHAVEPLMTTLWNQGEPYNILCPRYFNKDGTTGEHSATGCVATAMAQVVAYYRWPDELVRAIPGYSQKYETDEGDKNERRNAIPKGTKIDWDNMLDNYDGPHTAKQDTAVALLMYMVGVDCKMSYGASSASGYSEGVDGLITSFNFDDGTHIEKRDWYTLHAWDEMIYNEIATGHPVPYGGQNSGGGHAFVLDGYSIDGLYHVNWGWGGMCNGYFRIDILDPDNNEGIGASQTPGGYNMGQDCIIGMKRPDGIKDNPPTRHRLSANDWEIRGTNRFFCNFVNWTGVNTTWNMGVAYVDEAGELKLIGSARSGQISPNTYLGQEFTIQGLKEGTYHIVPVCKRNSDTKWVCHVCTDRNYVYTEVDANGQVVKMEIRPTEDHLEMTNLSFPGNHKRGDQQAVSATFRNNGEDEYFKEIHLLASRTEDKGKSICRTAIAIAHGEETTIALSFKPEQSGTWNIWLATDGNGNNVVAQSKLEISDEGDPNQHHLRYETHTLTNRSSGTVFGNMMQGQVTIRNMGNETYRGNVRLWLFKQASDGLLYGNQSVYVPMVIEPNKTAQASYTFRNLSLNDNYFMSILYPEGGDIENGGLKNMGRTQAGILYWNQNMTVSGAAQTSSYNTPSGAIALDLRNAPGVKTVRPNTNPNTLYVLADNATTSGLDGKNVVRGNTAGEITLVDNYSFFSPLAFTAQKATFTREAPAPGWEPITLPFAVDNLPAGILVEQFARQEEDGTITFERATKMMGSTPYVVYAPEPFTLSATDVRFSNIDEAQMMVGTNDYRYIGITATKRLNDIYVINEDGTAFVPVETNTSVKPFRAYFKSTLPQEEQLSEIVINMDTEGINDLPMDDSKFKNQNSKVFDLSGRQIVNRNIERGIYIVNGKKIVR